jgi:ABC-2 type transport system ATP-binding protein
MPRSDPDAPATLAAVDAAGPATIEDKTLVGFDGTTVAFTVFRPANASAASPVPVVFQSHGWGGKRATTATGIVGRLVEEGFGVVSVDARGHGDSGGFATVQHADYEVRDFIAVVDWVAANLDWVQREAGTGIPDDLVAGGTGYSYGGGFQLQLASHDPRIDAIAPEITWNDVADALAPNGAVKSLWVHALIGMAKQSGTRVDPRIEAWYEEAMLLNALPADAAEHFKGSNPDLGNLSADVLLVQGVPDVLFNLNQAVRTYQALEAAGKGDVRLFTHLTGHVLPLQPLGLMQERRATFANDGPCGNVQDAIVAWLDHKLRGGPAPDLAEVSFALEEGGCVRLDGYPTTRLDVPFAALPAPQVAGTLLVPLLDGPATVAGIPHLKATLTAPLGGIAHAGLVVVDAQGRSRIVDDQTMGFRLDGAALDLDLSGVATRLGAGDKLLLRIDGLNEWHATNGARTPGAAALTDVTVTIPLVA